MKMAKHNAIYYKIPDVGLAQKPLDGVYIKKELSYAVIVFNRNMYLVDIDRILEVSEKQKSITETECDALCSIKDTI
jgi:hypothetical protein